MGHFHEAIRYKLFLDHSRFRVAQGDVERGNCGASCSHGQTIQRTNNAYVLLPEYCKESKFLDGKTHAYLEGSLLIAMEGKLIVLPTFSLEGVQRIFHHNLTL